MNEVWGSIVIPTVMDYAPALRYLSKDYLLEQGVEIVVVKDRGWRSPSRTRNIGAIKAKGEVLCFMDDDICLNVNKLIELMKKIYNDSSIFISYAPPHILIVNKNNFIKGGGYDERFAPRFFEDIEIGYKLKKLGLKILKIHPTALNIRELRPTTAAGRGLLYIHLLRKSIWFHIEYKLRRPKDMLLRKHPVILILNILWFLEWKLYRRYLPRSIIRELSKTLENPESYSMPSEGGVIRHPTNLLP